MMDYVKMEAEYNYSKEVNSQFLEMDSIIYYLCHTKCEGVVQTEEGFGKRECRYE